MLQELSCKIYNGWGNFNMPKLTDKYGRTDISLLYKNFAFKKSFSLKFTEGSSQLSKVIKYLSTFSCKLV